MAPSSFGTAIPAGAKQQHQILLKGLLQQRLQEPHLLLPRVLPDLPAGRRGSSSLSGTSRHRSAGVNSSSSRILSMGILLPQLASSPLLERVRSPSFIHRTLRYYPASVPGAWRGCLP